MITAAPISTLGRAHGEYLNSLKIIETLDSVSTDPGYISDAKRIAANKLSELGIEVQAAEQREADLKKAYMK